MMKRLANSIFAIAAAAVLVPATATPRPAMALGQSEQEFNEDTDKIVEAIRIFFEAIETPDADLARMVMTEDGLIHLVRLNPDGSTAHSTRTHAEEFAQLEQQRDYELRERTWDPTIRHDDAVGVVSTPYDLWIDGEFSHCGTDIFILAKINRRWMITGISFTMQAEACPESPLGPLESQE